MKFIAIKTIITIMLILAMIFFTAWNAILAISGEGNWFNGISAIISGGGAVFLSWAFGRYHYREHKWKQLNS